MGGKIDRSLNNGVAPPIFRINGQNFHRIGSLLPTNGVQPKFAQLYIHDTEHEIENRINSVRGENDKFNLHVDVVNDIKDVLDHYNVLVKSFRMAKSFIDSNPQAEIKMGLIGRRNTDARTYSLPTASEVAALIVGDLDPTMGERDILVETRTGVLKRISELNPAYLPLQYPILFPYGEDGFREDILFSSNVSTQHFSRKSVSQREYFAFRIHERLDEISTLFYARRLFQQFLVDAYTMVESSRLIYIRSNQKALRCEAYKGLSDALTRGEVEPSSKGKRIILPSSFTSGARYMIQNYQDVMAICRFVGYPNLFITFTCNPKWPEIQRFMEKRNLKVEDRPDIVCRVFKMKLDVLIKDLKKGKIFGHVKAVVYTIEFQKRGLPHAHILLFLERREEYSNPSFMDSIISAEIPDKHKDLEYYKAVEEFMVHGPCGHAKRNSPCMVNNKCSKHFPKKFINESQFDQDGYPLYRRRDDSRTIKKNGIDLDNQYIVPHNRYILLKYKAHCNVEWCNQSRSIKYLFKYVNKGNDRVTAEFYKTTTDDTGNEIVDEINMYYDCRYISACEATWRLFSFEVQYRTPPVERLSFHLPDCQSVVFQDDDTIDRVLNRETVGQSMFNGWFIANKKFNEAKMLTYIEMPTKFVWKKDIREWQPRKKGFSVGRIFYVPPKSGEIYYLRCLLNIVRGPTSFKDIRTLNGVEYMTFRDACYAHGLLDDDKEYIDAINEASYWSTAHSMRKLFVVLITSSSIIRAENVWNEVWKHLCEDAQHYQRRILQQPDLVLTDEEKKNFGLIELEKLLEVQNKSLKDFPTMPIPNMDNSTMVHNRLVFEELSYDCDALKQEAEELSSKLTDEQRVIYDTVMQDISCNLGGLFFVYGYGGTGKTFLWRALSSTLRSKRQIVLNVASSGIASLLLPGGRTAHSRFAIPIAINEDSTCNIKQGSHLAELLIKTSLIIWDEAPMMHKHCFEALDRTMRDLLRFVDQNSSTKTFGGKTVVLGGDFRQILPVVPKGTRQDIVSATINSSYLWNICKADADNGILADVHTPEFLNGIRVSGLPNHSLTLKIGSPVMLMRNIDHSIGLCNGTRLIITKLADRIIEAEIMTGANKGNKVLIPRMSMSPSDPRLPFKFQRKQFPLMLSYAMTINKSQGQTLSHVGLLLKKSVFVHGQLYVAASRINNPNGLKILIANDSSGTFTSTTNVVYHEIFNNL
ncbi:uncharacterized protein LOC115996159 [Ipomoea triloba]|uniref:uncharacterized protein LOC115996159 n=1 Tax=Ipomoea triloba TaxID=35885 RepID=UPI00125D18D3|nr:uncharacterized protein LOC115996159 [Ipomoea triloba]